MIYELHAEDYACVRELVNKDDISVQLQTVLEGKNPGMVFADPIESPYTEENSPLVSRRLRF